MTDGIDRAVGRFVDAGEIPGAVGAVVTPDRTEFFRLGAATNGTPIDEGSPIGIHSITKPFTVIALMTLVREGRIALDDPVAKLLPGHPPLPRHDGRPILIRHLATHTSALPVGRSGEPTMPPLPWWSPRLWRIGFRRFVTDRDGGPLAGLTWPDLLAPLAAAPLTRAPGAAFEYSNVGLGLLGHVVGTVDGRGFETAVTERVWKALGLTRTRLTQPRGSPKPPMFLPLGPLAAAGGAISCAADLAEFVRACLVLPAGPVPDAIRLTLEPAGADETGRPLALGWQPALRDDGTRIPDRLYHTGGTHAFAGFDRARGVGFVLLCWKPTRDLDALAHAALASLAGEAVTLPRPREVVRLDPERLDVLTGTWRLDAAATVEITRHGDHLEAQFAAAGRPGGRATLWPESADRFFCREWDCRVVFQSDGGAMIRMYSFEGLYRKEHP